MTSSLNIRKQVVVSNFSSEVVWQAFDLAELLLGCLILLLKIFTMSSPVFIVTKGVEQKP